MDRRFRNLSTEKYVHNTPSIKIDDKELKKISIEIKRKIPASNETKELDHSLDKPEEIKIYRSRGEGSRPIFARSDIVVNKEEEEEQRIISSSHSPQKYQTKSSTQRHSFDRDSPHRSHESKRHSSRTQDSPKRSRNSRSSPRRDPPGSSRRDYPSSSSNRSRSRESRRSRRSRSRSRSSRREFGRRRNSRSPDDRDRRRYVRKVYEHMERDRKHNRSRSPRYHRSSSRRRSRSPRPLPPVDPAALGALPFIISPDINFYRPEDAVWFQPPIRPPFLLPRGFIPPGGLFRGPIRPPRIPFIPPRQQFRQIRPINRPPR